ncbi:ATP-binding cassette sub-family G member 4-like [Uranotaenia lowii]|uniref:ATP-binding cassette sub-family G member 4-like n=1 Tax=Uranotaenia lowii TaxID=190385 RepID=UPI0024790AC2|nr:ATP-binding cassette sub-family G member 4-like [Uranotaenia lowii]
MSSEETVEVIIPLVKSITSLTFQQISYKVEQKDGTKHLLKNISGTFLSGRLSAIMGPSGAGKSSLLNVISGFRTKGVKGRILINNEPIDRVKYRQLIAYTAQDVPLLQNITVHETLHYAADLKLPVSVTQIHKTKIVNDIITLLGLEKCVHNQVKVLSGGERKRLSIGLELVSNPKIMFFDEPTSGLDSESSFQVISYMKDLAKQGRCVISVIHQPSSDLLELFDDIYVVADGRCMYKGSLERLIPTLETAGFVCPQYYNRADFALKVASTIKTDPDKLETLMHCMLEPSLLEEKNGIHDERQSVNEKKLLETGYLHDDTTVDMEKPNRSPQYPISALRQFSVLTRRTALGTIRNLALTLLRFIGHILFGLIIGAVFYNVGDNGAKVLSNVSCLVMVLMFIMFSNSMTVVLTFPMEMAVFVREHKSNCYTVGAYYWSKIVADFPLMLAGVTCFMLIAYYLTGQPNETTRIVQFWAICALMGWTAQMYGMVAGSIFPVDVSPFVVPSSLIPMILFSGFFIRYSELLDVFKPLTYVSHFRYGFEGLALTSYGFNRTEIGCEDMFCYYRKPKKVMEMLEIDQGNYWIDLAGLGVWIVVLHILLYISLRLRLRWNQ